MTEETNTKPNIFQIPKEELINDPALGKAYKDACVEGIACVANNFNDQGFPVFSPELIQRLGELPSSPPVNAMQELCGAVLTAFCVLSDEAQAMLIATGVAARIDAMTPEQLLDRLMRHMMESLNDDAPAS